MAGRIVLKFGVWLRANQLCILYMQEWGASVRVPMHIHFQYLGSRGTHRSEMGVLLSPSTMRFIQVIDEGYMHVLTCKPDIKYIYSLPLVHRTKGILLEQVVTVASYTVR